MKKNIILTVKALMLLFFCAPLLLACDSSEPPSPDALDRETSYAFGMLVAAQMGFAGISFDYQAFMEGFRDYNEGRQTLLTEEQAMDRINVAFAMLASQNEEQLMLLAETNLLEGEAYLAANAQRPGVVTTASGLQYEVIVQGAGEIPTFMDMVLVHYEGTFIDGTVFDSSFERSEPVQFPVHAVIQGWIEGLQLMNIGSTYRFVIPSDLAYGVQGAGPIPPNMTLIFTVELLNILR